MYPSVCNELFSSAASAVCFVQLVPENWRESADRSLLEMGGVETRHNDRQEM